MSLIIQPNREIALPGRMPPPIWKCLPGSQSLFLQSPIREVCFAGTRGPGKTDSMLFSFAQHCGRGYGDYWRGIIFRRNYKHLDDIINKSKRWFNRSAQKPRFLAGSSSLKWVWPTGEELLFRAFEDEEDYWSYHGHEYPFIGWEELTSWPSINCYESMKSCNRSSFHPYGDVPMIPRYIRSSTNPYGVGHNWVKNYFIDPAPYGQVIVDSDGNKRVALFGSIRENPHLGDDYVKTLQSITDPNKRKAWLYGSWDITSGGMFDDLWDASKHIIKPFKIPATWKIDRAFDWGSSKPFSVGWWAQSDGTDAIMSNGTTRSFPRKTLFRIGEWYGCTGKPNEGVHMTARNVAIGILNRERLMGLEGRVNFGPADSAIYNVTDDASIGQNMESEGVFWTLADKKAGSRKNGWELIRDRLSATAEADVDKPGLLVFETCRDFIRTVPSIPRDPKDPDDVDCFVAGTMISCPNGLRAVESLKPGDFVNTPIGPRKLAKAGLAGVSPVIEIGLSNGEKLRGTLDHKIYVENAGLRPLCKLLLGDTLATEKSLSWLKLKFIMERFLDAIPMRKKIQPQGITFPAAQVTLSAWGLPSYTELFGAQSEDQFQKDLMSTTKTMTQATIQLKTLNYGLKLITQDIICKKDLLTVGISQSLLTLGEKANKDKKFLEKILKSAVKILPSENLRALIVVTLLQHNIQQSKSAGLKNANLPLVDLPRKKNNALSVVRQFLSNRIPTKKSKLAVISVDGNCADEKVYYLTVEQAHLFYANGVLSSNTDAEDHTADETRYRVLAADHIVHKIKIGGH